MAKKAQKTRKTAAKRFKVNGNGKISMRKKPGSNHKTGKMNAKFNRKKREKQELCKSDRKRMSEII
jgi:ribosomal protein L35